MSKVPQSPQIVQVATQFSQKGTESKFLLILDLADTHLARGYSRTCVCGIYAEFLTQHCSTSSIDTTMVGRLLSRGCQVSFILWYRLTDAIRYFPQAFGWLSRFASPGKQFPPKLSFGFGNCLLDTCLIIRKTAYNSGEGCRLKKLVDAGVSGDLATCHHPH